MSASLGELFSTWYYASDPTKYIVKTGFGINDMVIMKSGMKWAFQNATIIDVAPRTYEFNLHAMSSETLPFILPGAYTIGPDVTNGVDDKKTLENLKKYARFLGKNFKIEEIEEKDKIIKGVIEGETRVLAATMTIKELFSNRDKFKGDIIKKIDEELHQFGLKVYNANIRELQDTDNSTYFKNTVKKILADAENQAKIDVANATFKGETESKEKEINKIVKITELDVTGSITKQKLETNQIKEISTLKADSEIANNTQDVRKQKEIASLIADADIASNAQIVRKQKELATQEADKKLTQNEQQEIICKSDAKLLLLKAEQDNSVKLANLKYEKDMELKKIEYLERNNKAELVSNIEKLRADNLALKKVQAEELITETEAEVKRIQMLAEAELFRKQKEAEAQKLQYQTQADGIKTLMESFGGNNNLLMSYMMLKDDQYTKLAEINSRAINGLNPKINIWTTGNNSENTINDTFKNIMQSIPPLFTTIEEQTGVKILPNIVSTANLQ